MLIEYLLLLASLLRTLLCSRADLVAENRKCQDWGNVRVSRRLWPSALLVQLGSYDASNLIRAGNLAK